MGSNNFAPKSFSPELKSSLDGPSLMLDFEGTLEYQESTLCR